MITDVIKTTGCLNITLFGPDGEIKVSRNVNNLVVTTGKIWIAARMKDNGPDQMGYMGVGSGIVEPNITNTGLGTPLSGGTYDNGRVALDTAGGVLENNSISYSATFLVGVGTGTITEAGIFTASSSGTMLCRTQFLPINKAADDTLSIIWTITIN